MCFESSLSSDCLITELLTVKCVFAEHHNTIMGMWKIFAVISMLLWQETYIVKLSLMCCLHVITPGSLLLVASEDYPPWFFLKETFLYKLWFLLLAEPH